MHSTVISVGQKTEVEFIEYRPRPRCILSGMFASFIVDGPYNAEDMRIYNTIILTYLLTIRSNNHYHTTHHPIQHP